MRAVLKKPGKNPEVVDIENTLNGIRSAVGGYFQAVVFSEEENIIMLCDEEGKLNGLDYNFSMRGKDSRIIDDVVGNVLFVSAGDEDFRELNKKQIQYLMDCFRLRAEEWHFGKK